MITPDKIQEHLDESVHQHLSLLATSHLAQRERLMQLQRHFDENKYIEKLQEQKREMQEHYQSEIHEMRALRLEFNKIKTKQTQDHQAMELLQGYSSMLPITFTLDDSFFVIMVLWRR